MRILPTYNTESSGRDRMLIRVGMTNHLAFLDLTNQDIDYKRYKRCGNPPILYGSLL